MYFRCFSIEFQIHPLPKNRRKSSPLCNVIILTEPFTTTLFHLPVLPPPEPLRRMWPFKCCAETINWIVISAFRVLSYALLLPGPLNSGFHSFSTLLEHSVHSTLQEMHHPLLLLPLRFEIGNSCCTSTGLGAKLPNRKCGDKIRDSECVCSKVAPRRLSPRDYIPSFRPRRRSLNGQTCWNGKSFVLFIKLHWCDFLSPKNANRIVEEEKQEDEKRFVEGKSKDLEIKLNFSGTWKRERDTNLIPPDKEKDTNQWVKVYFYHKETIWKRPGEMIQEARLVI